jgi:hypothetical protein
MGVEGVVGKDLCVDAVVTDPYHVVAWGNDALDKLRRGLWNDARKRCPSN